LPPWLHTATSSTSSAAAAQSPARPAKVKAVQQHSDAPAAVPVHLLQQQQDLETQEGLFHEDPDVCTQQHFQYSNIYSGEQHNGSGSSSYEQQQQQQSQEQFQERFQEQSQAQDGPFLAGGNVLSAGQDPNFLPLSSLSDSGDEVCMSDAPILCNHAELCVCSSLCLQVSACVAGSCIVYISTCVAWQVRAVYMCILVQAVVHWC
jgi:hypothetical protein